MPPIELHTPRLHLRAWRDDDLPAFAELNADPEVMRHFPACMSREQSDALAARIHQHIRQYGFGQWVVEHRGDGGFVGVVGLQNVNFDQHFTPAVEIGWRLMPRYWGQGLASEAALRSLATGFAYDNIEDETATITLRDGGEKVNELLEKELNERLRNAGIIARENVINYANNNKAVTFPYKAMGCFAFSVLYKPFVSKIAFCINFL